MKAWELTLLFLLGSMLGLQAQTAEALYQWPIEGAKAGEGILYRPQEYIDNEHNFDRLFIGAELGTNVVSPCDGVVTYISLNYLHSLNSSSSRGGRSGSFNEIVEQHRESMEKNGQDIKYLSYQIHIKSNDGNTLYIGGLSTDAPLATGQNVKKGDVLGKVHYSYKKIHQPSIHIGVSKGGKPDDPLTPFGLKTTFIPPVNREPKKVLSQSEAIADYRQLASSIKEIYPSLDDFMTEEEYDAFVEGEIAKIPESISLVDFARLVMNYNRRIHDSHMWFNYGINLSPHKTQMWSPLLFGMVGGKMRVLNTTEEYKTYVGREIERIDGKHVDTLCMELLPYTSMIYDAQVESVLEHQLVSMPSFLYYRMDKDAQKGGKTTFTFVEGEKLTVPLMKAVPSTWYKYDGKIMSNWHAALNRVVRKENVRCEILNDSTAHIWLGNFNLMETEEDSMLVFLDHIEKRGCNNLIIDLRNNPGGNPSVLYKLVNAVMDEPIKSKGGYMKVNTQTIKSSTLNYPSGTVMFEDYKEIPGRKGYYKMNEPKESSPSDTAKALYTGHIYILINANSASASTTFAGIMKRNARGYVIGRETKTAYHCMNALRFADIMLHNSMFKCHIPITRIVSDEFVCEDFPYGRGVIPHLNIPITYEEVTSNGNLIYDKALELIRDGIYLEEDKEELSTDATSTKATALLIAVIVALILLVILCLRWKNKP